MRLLDKRNAKGSGGSAMRLQSWGMSADVTERLGSFLKDDFAPRVAASLRSRAETRGIEKMAVTRTIADRIRCRVSRVVLV